MPNAELLRETLRHIQQNPESWDQKYYRRGSSGCFAFHAALLARAELAIPEPVITERYGSTRPNHSRAVAWTPAARDLGFAEGEEIDLHDFACRALELTESEAAQLFYEYDNLSDLEAIAESLVRQAVSTP